MPHSGSAFSTSSKVRCDARYQNECWYSMPRLKSFCASALQEVSKFTVPSVALSARAGCPSARPVESVIAIARVVFIALLHFFGCFDDEGAAKGGKSLSDEPDFYSRFA